MNAVPAAAISVVLEVMAYGLAAAAASVVETDPAGAAYLDAAGVWLNQLLGGGLGIAVACGAWAMLRSGLFPRSLAVLGLVSGAALVAAQPLIAPAFGSVWGVLGGVGVNGFWVWMLWAGVLLWRRTPRRA